MSKDNINLKWNLKEKCFSLSKEIRKKFLETFNLSLKELEVHQKTIVQ